MEKEIYTQDAPELRFKNIPELLLSNVKTYGNSCIFHQKNKQNEYIGTSWIELLDSVKRIAFNLKQEGFTKGDKMILFSRNNLEMLKMELAVMSIGGIAVPIFAHFKKETATLLIKHSDAKYLYLEGEQQLNQISSDLNLKKIICNEIIENHHFNDLCFFNDFLKPYESKTEVLDSTIGPETIALNMYTSGTMGIPKCVQLTHKNILSQQDAIQSILQVTPADRMLSYLPWHHSFGGIFELFTALYNSAPMFLEDSYGKNVQSIIENWKVVKPTFFFSVPKVYQSLYEYTACNEKNEKVIFNKQLRFIFTAAAALPEKLSLEFEKRGIKIIEGWGLTETSPCCTLTNPNDKREDGVVGRPIPGVRIRISKDSEIEVKGPNVMLGYYKNDEANKDIFTPDGWYRTGDVGEIVNGKLKLISRKDRIFKLSNGEKVIPSDLEKAIEKKCHYVQYAVVAGGGKEFPVALIFPNLKLLQKPDYHLSPDEGCFCPRDLNELGKCLTGCLNMANNTIGQKFSKVKSAAIIHSELSLDDKTLTPSMKVAPNNVIEKYKSHLLKLYGENVPVEEEVYIIELDPKNIFPCTK